MKQEIVNTTKGAVDIIMTYSVWTEGFVC
eukprot:SAG11_NODE_41740_length_190_cov_23.626374_1_plen_28_part_10